MNNHRVFKRNFFQSVISGTIPIIFTFIIIVLVLIGLRQAEESNRAEGLRMLEEAIHRAVIHSYAVEGFFPESLAHISETYGIYIDSTRFVVHYDVFAQNMPPYIRVMELR